VYLPYEDLYLRAAQETSRLRSDSIYHFLAELDAASCGYQSAIKTGTRLNALHGAFDRERNTNYFAYDKPHP